MNFETIIAYEQGELTFDEAVEMFQEMIEDGSVWVLQGSYQRTALALIESGDCIAPTCAHGGD